jgi:S-adenosyl-L-methionine hydrolase (adenosine-forming)
LSNLPVITLTTDFGNSDGYAGSVKGVILGIAPGVGIVDISNSVRPQDIFQASFLIKTAYPFFPEGTIHLVIVDPGVGSSRKAIILKTDRFYFIAPDNGVLTYIIGDYDPRLVSNESAEAYSLHNVAVPAGIEAYEITNSRYWRDDVSPTFHGRDIFGPVAAHLARGVLLSELGRKAGSIMVFNAPGLSYGKDGKISGRIIYIDNFGNLVTNFRKADLPENNYEIGIAGRTIQGLSGYYAQQSGPAALIGSSGYLEIAVNNSSAAKELKAGFGDEVMVHPAGG